jgi:polyisoprenoid-binding protein YceI
MTQPTVIVGRQAPPAGVYSIDSVHSHLGFSVRHLAIARVRGRFREFSGTINIAEVPEQSSAEATIQAASIDTGDPDRDAHLRSPEFLDVERYPVIVYRSTSVQAADGDQWEVKGDLTIRDRTRPVTMLVEFEGTGQDPWGNVRAGFAATATMNRDDWGVSWNQALEAGGFLVGKELKVELNIEAVLQNAS